ncbi:MAG TPA: hypothetical protein DCY51_08190 [Bacteroidetes bacterium]|nr:hypothetical protein [Bacteroidota bacterium]
MKKQLIWIILLLAAGLSAYFVFISSNGESGLRDETNFAYEDVGDISKIRIKDREGSAVVMTRQGDHWMINDSFRAFPAFMDQILNKTIAKIRILGPVPKTAQENVIRQMVGRSIHVQIYDSEGDLARDYYVGGGNPDMSATYLHINGSKTPYLANILGSPSLLEARFSANPNDWIDRKVFDYEAEELASITVTHAQEPEESFTLTRVDSTYTISPAISNLSQSAARSYFALFSFKNYEGFAEYLTESTKDSIMQSAPFLTITTRTNSGEERSMHLFEKKSTTNNSLYDRNGNMIVEDTERYFAKISSYPFLVTVQHYVMGKLIAKRSYFLEE